ncbi:MAG: MBL fold metallo-hydrolase [Bdellovibrionaceae bacterium]|nr:MBL fold metallo-hydrolase [Pseudobdellovibrionaceae bacterium]
MQISRILHAGYVFESEGMQIAFDPIFENPFSGNCFAYPNVHFDISAIGALRLRAVFISHFHDDHLSFHSLKHLSRDTPIYLFCIHPEIFDWIRKLGFSEVHSLVLNEAVRLESFVVTPRRALDHDVDSIFHIEANGVHVLNVVDSWIDDEVLALLAKTSWDLVLWPFQTMRELEVLAPTRAQPATPQLPEEWILQLRKLKPKRIVASSCQFIHESWSWYNRALFPVSYTHFRTEIESEIPGVEVIRLNPSQSFNLTGQGLSVAPALSWVHLMGKQDVDYEYDPSAIPTPTSEIAMRFPPLSLDQKNQVSEFCRLGIIQKFRELELLEEGYFSKARRWRLSTFDHQGELEQYYYSLIGEKMSLIEGCDETDLSWCTELPAAKLYAALKAGESLASMYVRINNMTFAPQIEGDLADADLLEDPLIRCLFNREFGSYQAAQLKEILQLENRLEKHGL